MRALLFLLPLAAPAVANPCDPACDPKCDPKAKSKASVAVVTCDPQMGGLTRVTTASPVRAHPSSACGSKASSVCSTAPAIVSVGQGGSCGSVATSTACGIATASSPSAVASTRSEPTVIRLDGQDERLSDLADLVRIARTGQSQTLDEESREEVRAAVQEAREVAREALENAREAQRSAADEMREAMREAEVAQREAHEVHREALREAQQAQHEAQRAVYGQWKAARAANPEAFGGVVDDDEIARDALKSAQEALAQVEFDTAAQFPFAAFGVSEPDAEADASAPDPADLEDRIRALERIAREQGHDTTDGSLEDRVEALERALGARQGKTVRLRAPRAQSLGGTRPLRAYKLEDDGKLREYPLRGSSVAPLPSPRAVPHMAPVPPVAPVAPTAPVAPAPPAPGSGSWLRSTTPAPAQAPQGLGYVGSSNDDRRAIEDAMRSLRSEADALRAEVQRMREKIDGLPRAGGR